MLTNDDPRAFMGHFAAAVGGSAPVVVGEPEWSGGRDASDARGSAFPSRGWLLIKTGGSSGGAKLARHDEKTLVAAVRGFCAHFSLERVNAVSVLPLYHVSGLMAWMRSAVTGGVFAPWSWTDLKQGRRPELGERGDWVISLVPTQLQRLLEVPAAVEWLRRFRIIFIGGGPIWPALADAAAQAGLRISLSYGMTETAAMVAALQPEEFLAGARGSGRALPHAHISVTTDGIVRVAGDSVYRGYWPEFRESREFVTQDFGRIDERGQVHVLGRADAVIVTGGEKVQPADVEAALRASGAFDDVAVIGVPDPEWGEAVVACYPAGGRVPDLARACAALAVHQRPKRLVAIADWPRNAQGKVDRAALLAAIANGVNR
ncbi:MAG TPA: AMP-binding protein [Opitutaceae bacterium]|nr:AMP-binding protein [Opitutaceae bacterium]